MAKSIAGNAPSGLHAMQGQAAFSAVRPQSVTILSAPSVQPAPGTRDKKHSTEAADSVRHNSKTAQVHVTTISSLHLRFAFNIVSIGQRYQQPFHNSVPRHALRHNSTRVGSRSMAAAGLEEARHQPGHGSLRCKGCRRVVVRIGRRWQRDDPPPRTALRRGVGCRAEVGHEQSDHGGSGGLASQGAGGELKGLVHDVSVKGGEEATDGIGEFIGGTGGRK